MCVGIVAALGLRPPGAAPGTRAGARRQLAYNAGRLATYAGLGAIAGALGGLGVGGPDARPFQIALLVAANAIVVLLGLSVAGVSRAARFLEKAGTLVWRGVRRLGGRLTPSETAVGSFAAGLVWGFLPCGLVYGVLATALAAGGALRGAFVMAAFGAGTLPNLLAAGLAAETLRRFVRGPRIRLAAGAAIVVIGVIGLIRVPHLAEHLRHGMSAGR